MENKSLKLVTVHLWAGSDEEKVSRLSFLVSNTNLSNKAEILHYLSTGCQFANIWTIAVDLLQPDKPSIDAPNLFSDGLWAWTGEIPYYVEKYNVTLPNEFIDRMRSFDWSVPPILDPERLWLAPQEDAWLSRVARP
jgi:hypothetical protein